MYKISVTGAQELNLKNGIMNYYEPLLYVTSLPSQIYQLVFAYNLSYVVLTSLY